MYQLTVISYFSCYIIQNGDVNTSIIGNLRPSYGLSLISYRNTSGAPSCIKMWIRSSSLLSKMILNNRIVVDSRFPNRPLLSKSSSCLINKCLLAYITTSAKIRGDFSLSNKTVFISEMHSRRIGKLLLNAKNSRSIFENYMLNSR